MESLPANQQDVIAQFAKKALQGSAGLPVGVQVGAVCPRWVLHLFEV